MLVWTSAVALWLGAAASTSPVAVSGACEDHDALHERIAALVPSDAPLDAVQLRAETRQNVWEGVLRFEVDGVPYERSLSAESCAALYEASALVIGLTIQPPREDDRVDPSPSAPDPDGSEPIPAATIVPEAKPTPVRPTPVRPTDETIVTAAHEPRASPWTGLHVQPRAGAGVAVGVLHRVHPLVTAGAALTGRRWVAALDLAYLPSLAARVAMDTQAIVQMGALQARGCPVWRLADARVAVPVCAGVSTGLAWGRGEGAAIVGQRGRETAVSLLGGPRVELHARWGGLLWLAAELVVPLRRLNFVIEGVGPVCCQAPLGAMLSIGAGWSRAIQRN